MKLTLGFSPCPNDTFIFDALIHNKIDTEGLEFEVSYDDVETLNHKAFRRETDVTKLSFHAFAYAVKDYVLLDAGSALGFGVGPLLISKQELSASELTALSQQLSASGLSVAGTGSDIQPRVGIPGKYTTANFLFSLAFPGLVNKSELIFSDIEDAVLRGEIYLGLIIHENRFTYQDRGLKKVLDLGSYWEEETGCPIPLGGIVIRRDLPDDLKLRVNRVLRRSVEFAFENPKSGIGFIRSHAQAMDEEVMYKHIELYVNKYSVDLGDEGRRAVRVLFDTALSKKIIPEVKETIFLTPDIHGNT